MPLPDAEVVAVQWAKAQAPISAIVGTRVATRLPKGPAMPFLTVFRVSGGIDRGEALIDLPLLQWDCFAATGEYSPDYATAYQLASTVVEEAHTFQGGVPGEGFILGFQIVNGPRRFEEPDTGWARYIVETLMMVKEE